MNNDGEPRVTLLPTAGHRGYRWRNGLGEAAEIAAEPAGTPPSARWTLSIATVEADLEFSRFPGVDRHLMALSPGGLGLVLDGSRRSLSRWEVASFAGEAEVSSAGVVGPTLDLNLMVARDRQEGALTTMSVAGTSAFSAPAKTTVFVVHLEGRLTVLDRSLNLFDVLRIEAGGTCRATGTATVAIARIRSRTDTGP